MRRIFKEYQLLSINYIQFNWLSNVLYWHNNIASVYNSWESDNIHMTVILEVIKVSINDIIKEEKKWLKYNKINNPHYWQINFCQEFYLRHNETEIEMIKKVNTQRLTATSATLNIKSVCEYILKFTLAV